MKKLLNGNFRIWWLCNGQRVTSAAAIAGVLCAYALVSTWDYQDQLNAAQSRAERAEKTLAEREAARDLPSTVFVVEAKTPSEANSKLLSIAADLDAQRASWK